MTNRLAIGNINGAGFNIRLSKPGRDAVSGLDEDMLFYGTRWVQVIQKGIALPNIPVAYTNPFRDGVKPTVLWWAGITSDYCMCYPVYSSNFGTSMSAQTDFTFHTNETISFSSFAQGLIYYAILNIPR